MSVIWDKNRGEPRQGDGRGEPMTRARIRDDLGLTDPAHWRTVAKVALFLVVAVPVIFVAAAGAVVMTGGGVQ